MQTFDNIIRRRTVGVARNSKNRCSVTVCLTAYLCLRSVVHALSCRHFQSMAKTVDATGMDDLNSELENAIFSSEVPLSKLGHAIAGGVTEYGLEVRGTVVL